VQEERAGERDGKAQRGADQGVHGAHPDDVAHRSSPAIRRIDAPEGGAEDDFSGAGEARAQRHRLLVAGIENPSRRHVQLDGMRRRRSGVGRFEQGVAPE
jgi:hypothetical protein